MSNRRPLNLTRVDRWSYVASGLSLLAWGLRRGSAGGGALAGVGGWLLYQAYTGNNPMFNPLNIRVNQNPREPGAKETIMVDASLTIGKPREQIYRFWRQLDNLPGIAPNLLGVDVLDERRSQWRVKSPVGELEWDSEITRDEENREIGWRTTLKEAVVNFGSVQFRDAPGGRGTLVKVHLEYVPPAGSFGTAIARMTGQSPERMVEEALSRLKQLLETGEIATTQGQSSGRESFIEKPVRPVEQPNTNMGGVHAVDGDLASAR